MKSEIVDRKKQEKYTEKSRLSATFLYGSIVGGLVLAFATRKTITKVGGRYMDTKRSARSIKKFIRKNKIDMSDYPEREYKSFNDFFTREIKEGKRPFSRNKDDLISVADSKLLCYKINEDLEMNIKGKEYTVGELLRDNELAKEYRNGYCLVFRLTVDDYHRYSYIDDGTFIREKKINGVFHTVGPIAFKKHKVFRQNQREFSILETKNFGTVIQMEVGALMVGKIVNHKRITFKRGEEKGYFLFGGSTVVVLIKENLIEIDKDIIKNSKKEIETKVKLGETIGKKKYN